MRRSVCILAVAGTVLAAACQIVAEPAGGSLPVEREFVATLDSPARTSLQGAKVSWAEGDGILYYSADGVQAKSFAIGASGEEARLVLTTGASDTFVVAAYGAEDITDNGSEFLSLKGVVKASQEGRFESGHAAVAATSDIQSGKLAFHNVTSFIKFGISRKDVVKAIFSSAGDEAVQGNGTVDITMVDGLPVPEFGGKESNVITVAVPQDGTCYIATLPVELSKGFRLDFLGEKDTYIGSVRSDKPLILERNGIVDLGTLDSKIEDLSSVSYVKVDKALEDWSGTYLLVADQKVADGKFNGSWLTSADIDVKDGQIARNNETKAMEATVTRLGTGYAIRFANGNWLGSSNANDGICYTTTAPTETSVDYIWNFSVSDGSAMMKIVSSGRYLCYNSKGFRAYKSKQGSYAVLFRYTSGIAPQVVPEDEEYEDEEEDTPPAVPGVATGWFELPVIVDADHDGVHDQKDNLYYASHSFTMNGKKYRNYTVCFDGDQHCPIWVAAPRHSCYTGGAGRSDAYKQDPDIPGDVQVTSKSTGGGCNKGHMLGSAERTCCSEANRQVFYYSNIAPQYSSGFNTGGGGWNILEDWVDTKVCADTLYEVLGTYFESFTDGYGYTANPKKISYGGRSDVGCPTMFYYILLRTKKGNTGKRVIDCSANELMCAAFVRTHTNALKGQKPSSREMMSVADLEKITGFTYFPNVPNAPKSTFSPSDWGL